MKTYWAIEDKKGRLKLNFTSGRPCLREKKCEIQSLINCYNISLKGCKPVKVELRRLEE